MSKGCTNNGAHYRHPFQPFHLTFIAISPSISERFFNGLLISYLLAGRPLSASQHLTAPFPLTSLLFSSTYILVSSLHSTVLFRAATEVRL